MYAHVACLNDRKPEVGTIVTPLSPIAKISNGQWSNLKCKNEKKWEMALSSSL